MTHFIPNIKQRAAAKKLHNAWLHLASRYRQESAIGSLDLLMEAERFVRCGFRMPDWKTWMPWE